MTLSQAEKRHAELVQQIRQHDKAYYVLAQPIVSDQEYDQLFQELLDIERAFPPLVKPDSPSQRVGGEPVPAFRRVKHEVPMLSLEKLEASKTPSESEEPDPDVRSRIQDENTLKGLADFDRNVRKYIRESKVEYVLEPKVDGVSITVHYENGKLVLGATRGDGLFGDDITSNIRAIRAIPLVLTVQDPPPHLEVRGEAYMPTSEFDRLNAELTAAGEQPFPNARNATAGTLKQLDPSIVTERPIRAVFYGVGVCRGIRFSTHWETINMLKRFGLPTQPLWQCKGIDQVLRCYNEEIICGYDSSRDLRSRVPYDIDGVVIKIDKTADRERIPTKARAPGYAIVHKPIPWIM
ncbi:MAG: DNA ligase LigA-related protein, partial [Limisphaerales bacterium]